MSVSPDTERVPCPAAIAGAEPHAEAAINELSAPSPDQDRLGEIRRSLGDLPTLPTVTMQALSLCDGTDWDLADIERKIQEDHALAARFLRLANSPYYGARREIATLDRALCLIGIGKVRSVLLTASVEGLHQSTRSNFPGKALWTHALAVAIAAEHITQELGTGQREEAFMAGLLHDIGRPVMDRALTDAYQGVVNLVNRREAESYLHAERQHFGFDHTDVGFIVATVWGFPPVITDAIRRHHVPVAEIAPLQASVSLADSLCHKLGLALQQHRDPELDLETHPSMERLRLDPSVVDELIAHMPDMVNQILSV